MKLRFVFVDNHNASQLIILIIYFIDYSVIVGSLAGSLPSKLMELLKKVIS